MYVYFYIVCVFGSDLTLFGTWVIHNAQRDVLTIFVSSLNAEINETTIDNIFLGFPYTL